MMEDGVSIDQTSDRTRALVVKFWSLVILSKVIVFVLGIGLILLAFTEYQLVGAGLTVIALLFAVRWVWVYRAAQDTIAE